MRRFKRSSVFFCRLYFALGEASEGEVKIDLKRNANPVRTYLHELIHLENPRWSETKVLQTERRLWKRMTQEEVFLLGKRLFSRKFVRLDE